MPCSVPPESSWEGATRGESDAADLRWARGGREARDRRDQLLPALHALNDRVGWISEGALDYVCRRLTVPPAEAYGVEAFLRHVLRPPPPGDRPARLHGPRVHDGGGGRAVRGRGGTAGPGERSQGRAVSVPGPVRTGPGGSGDPSG
ncbi:hypothetical protein STENM36S_09566 [Streptomyces tendae]